MHCAVDSLLRDAVSMSRVLPLCAGVLRHSSVARQQPSASQLGGAQLQGHFAAGQASPGAPFAGKQPAPGAQSHLRSSFGDRTVQGEANGVMGLEGPTGTRRTKSWWPGWLGLPGSDRQQLLQLSSLSHRHGTGDLHNSGVLSSLHHSGSSAHMLSDPEIGLPKSPQRNMGQAGRHRCVDGAWVQLTHQLAGRQASGPVRWLMPEVLLQWMAGKDRCEAYFFCECSCSTQPRLTSPCVSLTAFPEVTSQLLV